MTFKNITEALTQHQDFIANVKQPLADLRQGNPPDIAGFLKVKKDGLSKFREQLEQTKAAKDKALARFEQEIQSLTKQVYQLEKEIEDLQNAQKKEKTKTKTTVGGTTKGLSRTKKVKEEKGSSKSRSLLERAEDIIDDLTS